MITVNQLIEKTGMTPRALPNGERVIEYAYTGDLLSWVMGNAKSASAWVTIMTNRNIVAVAGLLELACIILTENTEADEEVLALANEKGVNILSTTMTSYEACLQLGELI